MISLVKTYSLLKKRTLNQVLNGAIQSNGKKKIQSDGGKSTDLQKMVFSLFTTKQQPALQLQIICTLDQQYKQL
jgi:hypothetical protein